MKNIGWKARNFGLLKILMNIPWIGGMTNDEVLRKAGFSEPLLIKVLIKDKSVCYRYTRQ